MRKVGLCFFSLLVFVEGSAWPADVPVRAGAVRSTAVGPLFTPSLDGRSRPQAQPGFLDAGPALRSRSYGSKFLRWKRPGGPRTLQEWGHAASEPVASLLEASRAARPSEEEDPVGDGGLGKVSAVLQRLEEKEAGRADGSLAFAVRTGESIRRTVAALGPMAGKLTVAPSALRLPSAGPSNGIAEERRPSQGHRRNLPEESGEPTRPAPPPPPAADSRPEGSSATRLPFLDVFRGMTIAGMVLVNSPGNGGAYAWLQHAVWHGWTPADLVFPSFLAIMGVSLAISLHKRVERGDRAPHLLRQVVKRTLLLFGFGLLINAFTYPDLEGLRPLGVLQRIAFSYLFGSVLFLGAGIPAQALTGGLLLAGYWAAMNLVPVPGHGAGVLTPEGNLASFLDRLLMPGRLSSGVYDHEGLLSTLPACATALIGVLAGRWLLSGRTQRAKAWGLLAAGAALAGAGLLWGHWFPINKNLWTSSFALLSGGAALIGMALSRWLTELRGSAWLTRPFEIFGSNALLAYLLSGFFYQLQNLVPMRLADGTEGNLRLWLTAGLFGRLSPAGASLAYSLAYVLAFLGLMAVLNRRKLFLKL